MATQTIYKSKEEVKVHRKYKTSLIEAACSKIIDKTGTVTAELLMQDAIKTDHPLHEYFEWDNTAAAYKYRKAQATAMIIATKYICYIQQNKKKKVTADVFDNAKNAVQVRKFLPSFDGSGFKDRESILSEENSRQALVERKISTLRSWCKSVVDIDELQKVRQAVLSAIE